MHECFGESSKLASASCVMVIVNKAFALIVELLSSEHCDHKLLLEIGFDFFEQISCEAGARRCKK